MPPHPHPHNPKNPPQITPQPNNLSFNLRLPHAPGQILQRLILQPLPPTRITYNLLQFRQPSPSKQGTGKHDKRKPDQHASERVFPPSLAAKVLYVFLQAGRVPESDLDEDGAEFAGGGGDAVACGSVAGREDFRGDLCFSKYACGGVK